MSFVRDRAGATTADVTIFIATLALAAALLYPAWSARGFRSRVDAAVEGVEAVSTAARAVLEATDRWPTAAPVGQAPPEIAGLLRDADPFVDPNYGLEWSTWSVVDSVRAVDDATAAPGDAPPDSVGPVMQPIVRTVGAVAVHSGDGALLAELADRYADHTSFVLDTTWLLILPDRGPAPAAP